MPEELSEFVQSLTTVITRRANKYAEMLDESAMRGTLRTNEKDLLIIFEQYAAAVLDRYVLPGPRTRDSLVFAHLYLTTNSSPSKDPTSADFPPDNPPSMDERRRRLLTALLAAEVEARGPLRLTRAQSIRLAKIYQGLGNKVMSDGLPLHAAYAFERAAEVYLQVGDHRARDRCLLAQARARHRSPGPLRVKVLETISEVLCGYGYQPYRLLGWIAFQLIFFSFTLALISDGPFIDTLYLALIGFINPPGLDDTLTSSEGARLLFVMEGYIGILSFSIFFALVGRRWF